MVNLSQASGEPTTTLLWASLASWNSLQKALRHQASGLHGRVVPWQTLWTASQATRGPAGGDSQEAGPRGREDRRVGSQPAPLGQDPLPAQHPQQGLCFGWAVQGKAPCQRSLRQAPGAKLPWPGSSATDVSKGEVRNPSHSPFATSMAFLDVVGMLPLLFSAQTCPWAPHSLLVIGLGVADREPCI